LAVGIDGLDIDGAQLDLSWPTGRLVCAVESEGDVRFELPDGLPDHSILALTSGEGWLDYRDFTYRRPGGREADESVVWDFPGVGVGLLVSGGEGLTVEFKRELPMDDSKRRALKTIAAFASGAGGTVLFGVDDDGEVFGIDSALVGLTGQDKVQVAVTDMIRSIIDPEPPYDLRFEEYEGKTMLLVEVSPGGRWHAVYPNKPEFYVRRGASTFRARVDEINAGFNQSTSLSWR
jgi:hypothetical protein